MESLTNWWELLDGVMKFFYAVAFTSTTILVIQTILMFMGMDADTDLDIDDGSGDVSLLSVRTITAFLVGLGWMGAILTDFGWSLIITLPVALFIGFILMMFVFWFMRFLHSMRESGNMDYAYAIGETGTVYLPIPPNKKKAGKVQITIQGRLTVVDAFTNEDTRIENRVKVRVLDVVGENALLVEPRE
jgi:membrane protein implicated in regulation of membrane protease activity